MDINIFKGYLKNRLFLILLIAASLLVVFFITIFFGKLSKKNDIPVTPMTLQIELAQSSDMKLQLQNIKLVEGYSADYQFRFPNNYYQIDQNDRQGKNIFHGQTPSKVTIIEERFSTNNLEEEFHNQKEELRGTIILNLPYYKNAESIRFSDESNKEVLNIKLTDHLLTEPELSNHCGDGICADNENILFCSKDCKIILGL